MLKKHQYNIMLTYSILSISYFALWKEVGGVGGLCTCAQTVTIRNDKGFYTYTYN